VEEPKTTPPRVPEVIRDDGPSVKLIWAWLKDQGTVSYSVREIEEALGLSHKVVHDALATLREKGLLMDVGEREERKKGAFYIKRR
jgi:DNA-binding transcriptional ArsR family regulator